MQAGNSEIVTASLLVSCIMHFNADVALFLSLKEGSKVSYIRLAEDGIFFQAVATRERESEIEILLLARKTAYNACPHPMPKKEDSAGRGNERKKRLQFSRFPYSCLLKEEETSSSHILKKTDMPEKRKRE